MLSPASYARMREAMWWAACENVARNNAIQTADVWTVIRRRTRHQSRKTSEECIKTELIFGLRSAKLVTVPTNILGLPAQRTTRCHVFQLLPCDVLGAKRAQQEFCHNLPIKKEPGSSTGTHSGPLAGLDHSTLSKFHYVAIVREVEKFIPVEETIPLVDAARLRRFVAQFGQ